MAHKCDLELLMSWYKFHYDVFPEDINFTLKELLKTNQAILFITLLRACIDIFLDNLDKNCPNDYYLDKLCPSLYMAVLTASSNK